MCIRGTQEHASYIMNACVHIRLAAFAILEKDFYSCSDCGAAVRGSATCTCQREPNSWTYLCQQVAVK